MTATAPLQGGDAATAPQQGGDSLHPTSPDPDGPEQWGHSAAPAAAAGGPLPSVPVPEAPLREHPDVQDQSAIDHREHEMETKVTQLEKNRGVTPLPRQKSRSKISPSNGAALLQHLRKEPTKNNTRIPCK